MKTLIIIPAYNEEASIEEVVREIKEVEPLVDVLVINDCSSDKTLEVCKKADIPYLSMPINLGIGGVVQTGYMYAIAHQYDIAVQMDGDGQHNPNMLNRILAPILAGNADMVVGSRFLDIIDKNAESFKSTKARRLGIRFFEHWIYFLSGCHITDATSGFRACNKRAMTLFAHDYAKDYPEPEAIMTALRNKLKVQEVSVSMRERQNGTSSIGGLNSIYYMLKVSLAVLISSIKPFHHNSLIN